MIFKPHFPYLMPYYYYARYSANFKPFAEQRVLDCGLASTPSMFMTTVDLDCDGVVQIAASHHPFNRNGLKFFTREGSSITAVMELAQGGCADE